MKSMFLLESGIVRVLFETIYLQRPLLWYTCVRSAPARSSAETVLISSIHVAGFEVGLMGGTPARQQMVLTVHVAAKQDGAMSCLSRSWCPSIC